MLGVPSNILLARAAPGLAGQEQGVGLSLIQSEGERQRGNGICPPHEGPSPAPSAWLPISKGPCTLHPQHDSGAWQVCAHHLSLEEGKGRPGVASVVVKSIASRARLSHVESASQTV